MLKLRVVLSIRILFPVFFLFGCALPWRRGPEQPQPVSFLTHEVGFPGETLSAIALWYTGSANHWREILKYNPALNPKQLQLGESINIPTFLAKNTDPLPKAFLSSVQAEKAARELDLAAELISPTTESANDEFDITAEEYSAPEESPPPNEDTRKAQEHDERKDELIKALLE